jgi:hypothetical protein
MVALLEQTQSLTPLSAAEKARLHELERVVEKHLDGFLVVGKSLAEIRNLRLYRQHYPTFEAYLRERWALSRSRADELIRSTICAGLLLSTTGSENGDTPLSPSTPEIVLRPISQLPEGDLQGQVWRLVSLVSPKGKTPTHSTCAKVVRLIRETISGQPPGEQTARALPAREQSFTLPVQRLAKIDSFDINVCLLHVKSAEHVLKPGIALFKIPALAARFRLDTPNPGVQNGCTLEHETDKHKRKE